MHIILKVLAVTTNLDILVLASCRPCHDKFLRRMFYKTTELKPNTRGSIRMQNLHRNLNINFKVLQLKLKGIAKYTVG